MTLNHISAKSSSVTKKHYSHADLQMEIRAGLTLWQATLAKILAGEDPLATRPSDIEDLERKLLGGAI